MQDSNRRKTDQFLMPLSKEVSAKGMYDLYPTLKIEDGKIQEGFESFAGQLKDEKQLVIDGYIGVFFDDIREKLGRSYLSISTFSNAEFRLTLIQCQNFRISQFISFLFSSSDSLFLIQLFTLSEYVIEIYPS